jgi:alginate O-acetyltransferase complex protein AlgJ
MSYPNPAFRFPVSKLRRAKKVPSKIEAQTSSFNRLFAIGFGLTLMVGVGLSALTLRGVAAGTAQDFNSRFADTLPIRQNLIQTVNALRYRFLSSGDDAVQIGQGGWLYLTQDLQQPTDATKSWQTRAEAVIHLSTALQTKGVKLILAVSPSKARIHPEHLLGTTLPTDMQAGYAGFTNTLERGGVSVVHLETALGAATKQQEVYYRTDTHWNTAGARVAARALAQTIGKLGIDLPNASFKTSRSGSQERIGDLIRLMSLDGLQTPWRPASDLEAPEQTKSLEAANQGLLGIPSTEVVLVGTSYCLRGNFHGALQESLSATVLNLAKEGSGFERRMTAYLNDPAFKNAPPKILIWEFNERFLYQPIDADLPSLTPSTVAIQKSK